MNQILRRPDHWPGFLFATGIENSYPTIRGGTHRIDEMAKCGHYDRWREDFDLVQEMGIRVLRYGPPIHTTYLGAGRYDWEFTDRTFADLRSRGIVPIADLCHFGVPDWVGDFQNPDFPELFACYARAFAARFPWVQLYTPVNEIYVAAAFSARLGWWNEQLKSERGYVTAMKHLVRANLLAMQAVLEIRPDAIFIQSEAIEAVHAETPEMLGRAVQANSDRFLSLDLGFGRPLDAETWRFVMDNGMTEREYTFFMRGTNREHCVLGTDYYTTNEHMVQADGTMRSAGETLGYAGVARTYWNRYRVPLFYSETNHAEGPRGDEAVVWLRKQWAQLMQLRGEGIPVLGFTWYSLTDQVDWDIALREDRGTVNPLGLYDLERRIRPVGMAMQQLIRHWDTSFAATSLAQRLPVVMPLLAPQPAYESTGMAAS